MKLDFIFPKDIKKFNDMRAGNYSKLDKEDTIEIFIDVFEMFDKRLNDEFNEIIKFVMEHKVNSIYTTQNNGVFVHCSFSNL